MSQDSFTVEYKLDSGTGEWTTQAPTDAGSYLVKLTRPGDDQYLPFELVVNNSTVALQINKEPVEKPQKSQLNYAFSNWNIKITKTPNIETDGKVIYKLYVIPEAVGEFQYIATFESTSFSVPEASRIIASGNQANPIYGIAVQSLEGRNYAASEESDIKSVIVDSSGNPTTIPLSALPSTDTYSADSTVSSLSCTVPVAPKVSALATQNVGNTPLMPLSPEQVCLNRGKEFQITLDLNQTTDVWGILANVDYDIETLELTSYTLGNMFTQEQYRVQEDLTAAPFRLLATLEIGTTSAQGAFVTLNFKVKETAQEKDTVISLSRLEVVGESAPVSVEPGQDVPMAVDETAPVLEGIADGQTYQGDTTVTVVEPHLQSVTVNGKDVTVTDHTFTLSPTLGELTVVATDYAGNQTTVTVTVEPIPDDGEGPAATGDSSHLLLWTAGMLLGLGGLVALAFVSTKQHKKS